MIYIVNATNNDGNDLTGISYQCVIEDNILKVTIHVDYPEDSHLGTNTFLIPININQYAGQYMVIRLLRDYIHIQDKNDETTLITFEKFLSPLIDFNYSNLYSNGYSIKDIGSIRFLSLYIAKNKEDVYVHPFFNMNFEAAEQESYQYIEKGIIDSDHLTMLTSSCQELKEHIEKWNIKKSILDPNIDISKSAAYLETEVDTLYKIIGLLLKNTEVDVSEYQPIIDAVESYNILNIKNMNKLVAEINEDKQNVRNQQEVYYDKVYK